MDFEKHLYGNVVIIDLLGGRVRNLRAETQAAHRKEQELERLKRAFGILGGAGTGGPVVVGVGGGGVGGIAPFIPPLETSIGFANRAKQSVGCAPRGKTNPLAEATMSSQQEDK